MTMNLRANEAVIHTADGKDRHKNVDTVAWRDVVLIVRMADGSRAIYDTMSLMRFDHGEDVTFQFAD